MDKKLTVIIPTYNMEKYLHKCLESLIIEDADLLSTLEVLVVNDGSKDSSSLIAHEFQNRYPNVFRVVDKENGNYGSCVNRGLEEETGKYIKVLDADDTFDTENFSHFLSFLGKNDVDCVMSDMIQVDGLGMCKKLCRYNLPEARILTLEELGDEAYHLYMHCVCYKTERLRALDYHQTEGISYTDQEWICLPMAVSRSVVYFPKIIYRYLVGRDGQTVDITVWERNFWMEIEGTKAMMQYRDVRHGSLEPDQNFVDLRIKSRMRTIYATYLMRFSSFSNEDIVRDIDRRLLSYDSKMYNELSTFLPLKRIPIPIVKFWRNGHFGWIPLYRMIYRAKVSTDGLKRTLARLKDCHTK